MISSDRFAAQVALIALVASIFSLVQPFMINSQPDTRLWWPTQETYWIIIVAVLVEENRFGTSLVYGCQKLLGAALAGSIGAFILYLDSILGPQTYCLTCSYKPFIVALCICLFTYFCVYWKSLYPHVGYFDRLVTLTFIILLLVEANTQLQLEQLRIQLSPLSSSDPSFLIRQSIAPPMARLASILMGIVLSMMGSLLFFPLTIHMARKKSIKTCLLDLSEFWNGLYTHALAISPTDIVLKQRASPFMDQVHMTVAAEEATQNPDIQHGAAPLHSPSSRSPSSHWMASLFTRKSPSSANNSNTVLLPIEQPQPHQEDIEMASDLHVNPSADFIPRRPSRNIQFITPEQRLRNQVHPISIKIIRTLERERARLEVGVKSDFRFLEKPHFIPVKPVDQVVRKLRNIYYHLISIYIDRLSTFKLMTTLQQDTGISFLPPTFVESLVKDQEGLYRLLEENELESNPISSPTSSPFTPVTSFKLSHCTQTLSRCLYDLSTIVSCTTFSGQTIGFTRRGVGSAELSARCQLVQQQAESISELIVQEIIACRRLLMGNDLKPSCPRLSSTKSRDYLHLDPAHQSTLLAQRDYTHGAISLLFKYWELCIEVIKSADAIQVLVRSHSSG